MQQQKNFSDNFNNSKKTNNKLFLQLSNYQNDRQNDIKVSIAWGPVNTTFGSKNNKSLDSYYYDDYISYYSDRNDWPTFWDNMRIYYKKIGYNL